MEFHDIVIQQKSYFDSNSTKSIAFRKIMLKKLMDALDEREDLLLEALHKDLGKSRGEGYMTEVGMVRSEIKEALINVEAWSHPKKADGSFLTFFPATNHIYTEPYGVVLIIAPWNYPLNLTLMPLVGAIAAGNCAIVKCSPESVHTSRAIKDLLADLFPPEYIYCPEADLPFETLWQERYDMIFFTGSPAAGRIVMKAASEHLTPVILELGGKSPCLVDASANIDLAARRIVWGKFMNAGQTCIAVDYVVVQESVKDALLAAMTKEIGKRYPHAEKSDAYPSIINQRHYDRLIGLMKTESSLIGGAVNAEKRRIAPTLMPEADFDHPIMEDEIFGPLLPIIAVKDMQNAVAHIKTLPNPLACYVFTENKAVAEAVIANLSFGGGCINDTLLHVTNPNLPFGGVGNSGMGSYHGKASFDAFSHKKSIVKNTTRFDISLRYAPFTERKVKWLKRYF